MLPGEAAFCLGVGGGEGEEAALVGFEAASELLEDFGGDVGEVGFADGEGEAVVKDFVGGDEAVFFDDELRLAVFEVDFAGHVVERADEEFLSVVEVDGHFGGLEDEVLLVAGEGFLEGLSGLDGLVVLGGGGFRGECGQMEVGVGVSEDVGEGAFDQLGEETVADKVLEVLGGVFDGDADGGEVEDALEDVVIPFGVGAHLFQAGGGLSEAETDAEERGEGGEEADEEQGGGDGQEDEVAGLPFGLAGLGALEECLLVVLLVDGGDFAWGVEFGAGIRDEFADGVGEGGGDLVDGREDAACGVQGEHGFLHGDDAGFALVEALP